MTGRSFSLTEQLAVTGAFLALVATAVGTEDDPGVVVTSKDTVKDLRLVQPIGLATPKMASELAPSGPLPSSEDAEGPVSAPPPLLLNNPEASHPDYESELGRVPRDFTNGPPES